MRKVTATVPPTMRATVLRVTVVRWTPPTAVMRRVPRRTGESVHSAWAPLVPGPTGLLKLPQALETV